MGPRILFIYLAQAALRALVQLRYALYTQSLLGSSRHTGLLALINKAACITDISFAVWLEATLRGNMACTSGCIDQAGRQEP